MNGKERRADTRYFRQLAGTIRLDNTSIVIGVNNISKTGAEISTSDPLSIDSIFEINIQLNKDLALTSACSVAWSAKKGSDYIFGVKFMETDIIKISDLLVQAGIIEHDDTQLSGGPYLEMFETTFESYHDEIFIRRAHEFVDYIKENDPEKADWAEELLARMKAVIESTKNSFETWARTKK
ncbi:PilZ domain-containing protein [Elusimicrobiota bacterium]